MSPLSEIADAFKRVPKMGKLTHIRHSGSPSLCGGMQYCAWPSYPFAGSHERTKRLWSLSRVTTQRRFRNAIAHKPAIASSMSIAATMPLEGMPSTKSPSLRWTQIDLENEYIDFNQPDRPRTNKRRTLIPIPRRLISHLRRARLRGSDTGFVINRDGRPIKDIKKGFKAACARAGVEDATPHTLRHTCATWLMQRGIDKWEAAGFLGMTIETLERNNAHHHPDHLRRAAEAF